MKLERKRPVLRLRHVDDENEVVLYDRYVYADTGIVCRLLGDVLEVQTIGEDRITFLPGGDIRGPMALHPGENCQFVAEIPGLIADGSGWQREILSVTWIPEDQTEGLTVGTMRKAVGIRLKKVDAPSKSWRSRFFGMPAFSQQDLEQICNGDRMLLAQINLYEARRFDPAGVLPRGDFLYLFLRRDPAHPEGCCEGSALRTSRDPDRIIADFNENTAVFPHATAVWEAEFFEAEGDYPGTKLMGVPTGWPDGEPMMPLLLQFNAKDAPSVTGLPNDEGIGWMCFTGSMQEPEACRWFSGMM